MGEFVKNDRPHVYLKTFHVRFKPCSLLLQDKQNNSASTDRHRHCHHRHYYGRFNQRHSPWGRRGRRGTGGTRRLWGPRGSQSPRASWRAPGRRGKTRGGRAARAWRLPGARCRWGTRKCRRTAPVFVCLFGVYNVMSCV